MLKEPECFYARNKEFIEAMAKDERIKPAAEELGKIVGKYEYTYHFEWMGRPIIQAPEDIVVLQEIIWKVKPDIIIETGIARGGSLIFYASMLELLGGRRQVIGIDIDIRKHNKIAVEQHPMYKRITMLEGSSIDENIIKEVYGLASDFTKVMLVLDSMHTYEHVLNELKSYAPLVKKGSYIVVCDTLIEETPNYHGSENRPWGKGNNPKTAVDEFLKSNPRFQLDRDISNKLIFSSMQQGYLKCTADKD